MIRHDDDLWFPHKDVKVEDLWPGDIVWAPDNCSWVRVIDIEPMNFGPFTHKVIT